MRHVVAFGIWNRTRRVLGEGWVRGEGREVVKEEIVGENRHNIHAVP